MNRRLIPAALAMAACAVVIGLWACTPARPAQPVLYGAALEPPTPLPALTFTRADGGGSFTTDDTRGRTSLFFFGYTHCADVCPLTLAEFQQIRRALGSRADSVDMYFVTLDPARDTTDWMRSYVANFPGVIGLVPSSSQLSLAQSTFNVVAERRDLGNGDYALDHTAAIYLVNTKQEIQLAYPYGTSPDDILSDLRTLTTQ